MTLFIVLLPLVNFLLMLLAGRFVNWRQLAALIIASMCGALSYLLFFHADIPGASAQLLLISGLPVNCFSTSTARVPAREPDSPRPKIPLVLLGLAGFFLATVLIVWAMGIDHCTLLRGVYVFICILIITYLSLLFEALNYLLSLGFTVEQALIIILIIDLIILIPSAAYLVYDSRR